MSGEYVLSHELTNLRKDIPWNIFSPDRCRNFWWTQTVLWCNCFPAESRNNRQDRKGSQLPSLLGCAWKFLLFLPLKSYSSSCFDFSFSRLCVLVFFPVSLWKGAVHWLPPQVTALPVPWCCGLHRGCFPFCHTSPWNTLAVPHDYFKHRRVAAPAHLRCWAAPLRFLEVALLFLLVAPNPRHKASHLYSWWQS